MEGDPQREAENDIKEDVNRLLQGKPKRAKPKRDKPENSEHKDDNGADLKEAPWRQRRVLELRLFDRIVSQMREAANIILEAAKLSIQKAAMSSVQKEAKESSKNIAADSKGQNVGNPKELGYDAFRTMSTRYQQVQKALQTVEGDLAENLAKIDLWLNREKEREAERPR